MLGIILIRTYHIKSTAKIKVLSTEILQLYFLSLSTIELSPWKVSPIAVLKYESHVKIVVFYIELLLLELILKLINKYSKIILLRYILNKTRCIRKKLISE
jgi:hypothetical protein